jgi:hypothetical protein
MALDLEEYCLCQHRFKSGGDGSPTDREESRAFWVSDWPDHRKPGVRGIMVSASCDGRCSSYTPAIRVYLDLRVDRH